jgi:hypothetical protein
MTNSSAARPATEPRGWPAIDRHWWLWNLLALPVVLACAVIGGLTADYWDHLLGVPLPDAHSMNNVIFAGGLTLVGGLIWLGVWAVPRGRRGVLRLSILLAAAMLGPMILHTVSFLDARAAVVHGPAEGRAGHR